MSTTKVSQAMILRACAVRNWVQVGPVRLGAGVDAVSFQDGPDGGGVEAVAESGEFEVDAPVAPRRVLGGEADDELFSVALDAGSAGPSLRVDPAGRGEMAVSGQRRLGGNEESVADPAGGVPGRVRRSRRGRHQ